MAREIKTGEIVALKKICMDNEREGVSYNSHPGDKKLHHENVIQLIKIVTSPCMYSVGTGMTKEIQHEQLNKIFELSGSPDENIWLGVSKMYLV